MSNLSDVDVSSHLIGKLNPRCIAVVGASADPRAIGHQPLQHLLAHGFGGSVVPINPKHAVIAGLPCLPALSALTARPDLVVVAVAATRVPEVVAECVGLEVPLVLILSSGFSETGTDGIRLQREIAELIRGSATRLIGPNCQGFMNISEGFAVGFGPPFGVKYPRGGVSMTSQSGAFGNAVLMLAADEGVGFRHYVSTGNEADTTTLEWVDAWVDDPSTDLVASYVEGWRDAHRARSVGERALRAGKPWLIWKVGRTPAGARAAASHTANLSGEGRLYEALIEQVGAIAVDDVYDLVDAHQALLTSRRPMGPRVAIVTVSGGAGILMADECERQGLELAQLAADTVEGLRRMLPAFGSANNPVDLTGEILRTPALLRAALALIAADRGVDMVALPLAALSGEPAVVVADALEDWQNISNLPLYVAWHGRLDGTANAVSKLRNLGIPVLRTPVRCARAIAMAWRFQHKRNRLLARPTIGFEAVPPLASDAIERLVAEGRLALNEFEGGVLLTHCGIRPPPSLCVTEVASVSASARAWIDRGERVVLKVLSADIPHKTEVEGVRLGLRTGSEVEQGALSVVESARRLAPNARIDGVLIQPMVVGAVEVMLGVRRDPHFGPVLVVGSGGTFAEWVDDAVTRLLPLCDDDMMDMLLSTRLGPRLNGWRGAPPADLPALLAAMRALSALAGDSRVADIEINPLFVMPQGQGVLAGDVVVQLRPVPPFEELS